MDTTGCCAYDQVLGSNGSSCWYIPEAEVRRGNRAGSYSAAECQSHMHGGFYGLIVGVLLLACCLCACMWTALFWPGLFRQAFRKAWRRRSSSSFDVQDLAEVDRAKKALAEIESAKVVLQQLHLMMVTVPEGAESGQQLWVETPQGQQVLVAIPEGIEVGQQFQCQVPAVVETIDYRTVASDATSPSAKQPNGVLSL